MPRSSKSPRLRHGRNRGRRNARSGQLRKVLLVLFSILLPVLALGGGGLIAYNYLQTEQIDTAFCYPRDDQYQVATFVDFSLTHNLSASQRRDLINTLVQSFEAMPANGRLSVFTTANSTVANVNRPVFSLCNPADNARDLDQIGAPSLSAPRIDRLNLEASQHFETMLEDLMASSVDRAQIASTSPILEQIRGISRYDFGAPLNQLISYSDGLQNSRIAQFCSVQGDLPSFAKFMERPDYREIAPDPFDGTAVDLLFVESGILPAPGMEHCSNRELRDFWIAYFEANGASSVRLTPLAYGSAS